jgi:hypothetical protein
VIERLGGRVTLESTLGVGTDVSIFLPLEHSDLAVEQETNGDLYSQVETARRVS